MAFNASLKSTMVFLSFAASAAIGREVPVLLYDVELAPDLTENSVSGSVDITIGPDEASPATLILNIGSLAIDAVSVDGQALDFSVQDQILSVDVGPAQTNRIVSVSFSGQPPYGMKFSENGDEVSTAFSTSQWMPALDSPTERADFRISFQLPAGFEVAAAGRELSRSKSEDGSAVISWSGSVAMPSYLYGFAAGRFRQVIDDTALPKLRFLAPPSFSEADLKLIFRETRHMLSYFEDKSGMAYPGDIYTQVLLRNGSGQELDQMAVFGEAYGRAVLEDQTAIWLGVHEAAHQWWGNQVTNASWTHFWLNEGLVNFLTAAYLGHRFGQEAYDETIASYEAQYVRLVDAGLDKPLVFPDWDQPSRADRSLVYNKGALFVHRLKQRLGEEAFWSGIRLYTQQHWGKPVISADFQQAMEQAAGESLANFFSEWVYPPD